jgi:acetyl esterase/lipase
VKKILKVWWLVLLVVVARAEKKDKFAFTDFKPSREFVYKSIDGMDLKMHVFDPTGHKLTDKSPVIILFFGGGWLGGQPAKLSGQCDFFAKQGIVAITADYRVKGRTKTTPIVCVKDGKSAIRWVRAHAADLGIDPNRVIGGGASAGGHVAAAAGADVPFNEETDDLTVSARPNALVLFNPVFDNGPGGYGHDRVVEYWEKISPMHNISAETPPTIAFFGDNDQHVPVVTMNEYKKRMLEKGRRFDLFIYKDQKHGFFNYQKGENPRRNKYFNETLSEAALFLSSLGYLEASPTSKSTKQSIKTRDVAE